MGLGVGGIASLVKCLSYKHEDPSSIPRTHIKNVGCGGPYLESQRETGVWYFEREMPPKRRRHLSTWSPVGGNLGAKGRLRCGLVEGSVSI